MHAQALSGMDSCLRDRSLFIAEDLGLNKVKFSQSPFESYFTEVIPPNQTFDDFRDLPSHVFIIQAKLSDPPLNPSKVFSDPPFWVLSYD